MTCKASDTQASSSEPNETLALIHRAITMACEKLAETDWVHSLPFQRFQALLTLFSKSFSPFPHGTCLLSVSSQYLALEENYLPFSAPIPKYATLRNHSVRTNYQRDGALTLSGAFFQRDLRWRLHWRCFSRLQFAASCDLQRELFRVQSPLLTESFLFSFPPLTYMLKFSG